MRTSKRAVRWTIAIVLLMSILVASYVLYCDRYGHRVAQGVSQEKLMQLHKGMSKSEVINKIGEPLYPDRYPRTYHYARPCRFCYDGIELTLTYEEEKLAYAGAEHYDLGFWRLEDTGPVILNQETFVRLIKE
jgi:hypothetical protein